MSLVKVWLHLVWSTKLRSPYLVDRIRQDVFDHIQKNAQQKNIDVLCVNGYVEHVHCLLRMNATQSVMQLANQLKGESSFWINKNELIQGEKFEWQQKYYAVSVDKLSLRRVESYIQNQEEHHRKGTLIEAWEEPLGLK